MKIYSKITNRNVIGLRLRIIGILILLHLPVLFIIHVTRIKMMWEKELGIILIVTLLILLVLYFRARLFEFDSSGEVISIRVFHPIFGSFERRSEFPKQKLKNYTIKNKMGCTDLKIHLKSHDTKGSMIKFSIQGLPSKQTRELDKSLEITKLQYQNDTVYGASQMA